jgi:hypothetical protein
MNPAHTKAVCFFNTNCNIFSLSMLRFSKRRVCFRFFDKNTLCILFSSKSCYVTCRTNLLSCNTVICSRVYKLWSSSLCIFLYPLPLPLSWIPLLKTLPSSKWRNVCQKWYVRCAIYELNSLIRSDSRSEMFNLSCTNNCHLFHSTFLLLI